MHFLSGVECRFPYSGVYVLIALVIYKIVKVGDRDTPQMHTFAICMVNDNLLKLSAIDRDIDILHLEWLKINLVFVSFG